MKNLLLLILISCLPLVAFAQVKHDYVWLNGDDGAGDVDPNTPGIEYFGINILNFNNGELNITRDYRDSDFYLTNGSISSAEGQLLFYTNGCKVFRANGEVMENGAGLNPGTAYDTGQCPDDGNSVSNGVLILPLPGNDSIYYVFHNSAIWGEASPFFIFNAIIYTTVVDVSQNNGLGAVVEKNNVVISDTLSTDFHAVRHANGEDWWILLTQGNSNTYYTILFTADGVAGVFEQAIGPVSDPWVNGMSCFSPDGAKYARYDYSAQVLLFDFDKEIGKLSNLKQLVADTTYDNRWGYSIAFSPSSRFLYVGSLNQLYQFDVEATDIQSSRVFLAEYDGYKYLNTFESNFGFMRLAPDCKIYMSSRSSTPMYHVINHPDRKGLECGFVQRGLALPAYNIASIPNFPNYRLGTGFPVCDSTIQLVVSSVPVLPPLQEVLVYPNPASSFVTIEVPQALASGGKWSLYNGVGQRVLSQEIIKGERSLTVDLAGVPKGIYFWEMRNKDGRIANGLPPWGKLIVSE